MLKKLFFIILSMYLACTISLYAIAQEEATIIYVKGRVKVQSRADGKWMDAKEGMKIENGDRIKTYGNSKAEISFDRDMDNILMIDQKAELLFDDISSKKTELSKGRVLAVLDGLGRYSTFEVRTPTAICGVAGSGIFVKVGKDMTTTGCHENQSFAKGVKRDGSFTPQKTIKQGYKRTIEKFRAPGELMKLTGREKRTWSAFKEDVRKHRGLSKSTTKGAGEESGPRKIMERMKSIQDTEERRLELQRDERREHREQKKFEQETNRDPYNLE